MSLSTIEAREQRTGALQVHADLYLQMIMHADAHTSDLDAEKSNILAALERLKEGQVMSEYSVEAVEAQLRKFGFLA